MNKNRTLLDLEAFSRIVRHTPLVSIDLVTTTEDGQVLLGLRKNRPAKDFWFIPGGRILKDETILEAFQRISVAELGREIPFNPENFLGIYEHFYPQENFAGEEGYGTHYIVLAFSIRIDKASLSPPGEQHLSFRWFQVDDLLKDDTVHLNTKNYFNGTVPVR